MKRLLLVVSFVLALATLCSAANPSLEDGFEHPPDSAKPRTWWHWVSGNISSEGIIADMEAMKRIGLGGAQIFTVDQSAVNGPVEFMSPEWRQLVHQALTLGGKLDFEMAMEGCDGWSESGGPWVKPEQSMQMVVWTETTPSSGQKLVLSSLPQPETKLDYYQDIAIFAYPTPPGNGLPAPVAVTASSPGFDGAKIISHDAATLGPGKPGEPRWVQLEFAAPVTSAWLDCAFPKSKGGRWELQTSDDGKTYKKVCGLPSGPFACFSPQTAKFFRVYQAKSDAAAGPLSITKLGMEGARIDRYTQRAGMSVAYEANTFTESPANEADTIDPKSVVDLTGKTDWDVPPGNWTVVRMGHTSTGATTHPSTKAGLECDKLSRAAVQAQFEGMFGPVMADSPEAIGKTLRYVLLDSWEAGCENWTPLMREEFQKRRGYDLWPWLPVLSGRIVTSLELSERFLWDFRRTLADLVADNHYGTLQALAHQHGMGLTAEATGIGMPTVADQLQCKGRTDIPMGEFWVSNTIAGNYADPREAAAAAHTYGQNIAATESFTSTPAPASWKNDPYSLKLLGDMEYCNGVNRFIFHRYAHQPWLDRVPGMSMGPWGINFERTNTWWEQGAAWISYLTRCQYLLQQGHFVADICYYYGEGVPVCVRREVMQPAPPAGYDNDFCDREVLLTRMSVDNDRVVLPDGMSYRVLVLPDIDRMTLPVLKKIRDLVQAGATVYGPRPRKSPSLNGYPASDTELAEIAEQVWGNCDGKTVTEHAFGKGRIVWGQPLEKVVAVPRDFAATSPSLRYIHRQDGDADIYFVSTQNPDALQADCTFRVAGKAPELWHPDTGRREFPAIYKTENGVVTLPIQFDPTGSVFVIFRRPEFPAAQAITVMRDGQPAVAPGATPIGGLPVSSEGKIVQTTTEPGTYVATTADGKTHDAVVPAMPAPVTLTGPWNVTFPPKRGAPESATFDHLISWTDSPEEGVRYFSGTATYTKDVDVPAAYAGEGLRVYLDLGVVKNLAEVSVNGQPFGVLWKPPFRADITGALHAGTNHLEIKITNLWPNRLIGDEKLPQEKRVTWASVSLYKPDSPLLPSGLLGPVTVLPARTVYFP